MADEYYALVYLRGCGEMIQHSIEVDESDPELVTLVIRVIRPEKAGEDAPGMPLYDLPLDDPRHRCVQGLCDDHAGRESTGHTSAATES